jgi:hypothetical protein
MALRFLLVGLVIGLGVDLPSGEEISSWARAGSDWVRSRLDDVLGPEAVAGTETSADPEFAAIVDEMAGAFSADLARVERPVPRVRIAAEAIEVPEDVEPGIAYALNRGSQGEGLTPEDVPAEAAKAPALEPETVPSGRTARLASAVRLTRQAASAWWAVVRGAEATAVAR